MTRGGREGDARVGETRRPRRGREGARTALGRDDGNDTQAATTPGGQGRRLPGKGETMAGSGGGPRASTTRNRKVRRGQVDNDAWKRGRPRGRPDGRAVGAGKRRRRQLETGLARPRVAASSGSPEGGGSARGSRRWPPPVVKQGGGGWRVTTRSSCGGPDPARWDMYPPCTCHGDGRVRRVRRRRRALAPGGCQRRGAWLLWETPVRVAPHGCQLGARPVWQWPCWLRRTGGQGRRRSSPLL